MRISLHGKKWMLDVMLARNFKILILIKINLYLGYWN